MPCRSVGSPPSNRCGSCHVPSTKYPTVAASRPPNDLDRRSSVLTPPRVHRGLAGAVSAQHLSGLGVGDLVDRLLTTHASRVGRIVIPSSPRVSNGAAPVGRGLGRRRYRMPCPLSALRGPGSMARGGHQAEAPATGWAAQRPSIQAGVITGHPRGAEVGRK